eukprot:TRINITY_DN1980_c1_g3_i1.p1 TRINITY_DN1980_c1_g3~~TRINITY_DN1980_c1_g3_i1.p1  ORF type:complete len:255 (+),score=62.16 TRINITY_DN1980_c1_g3_i1:100-864(+)
MVRAVRAARSAAAATSASAAESRSSGAIQSEAVLAVGPWGAATYEEAVANLPQGWGVQKSDTTGRFFYVNTLTDEARWVKPHRAPKGFRMKGGDVKSLLRQVEQKPRAKPVAAAAAAAVPADRKGGARPRTAASRAAKEENETRGATTHQVMYPRHKQYERRTPIRPPSHRIADLNLAAFDGETSYQQQFTVDSFDTLLHRRAPLRSNINSHVPHFFTDDRSFLTTAEEMAAHLTNKYPPRWRVRSAGAARNRS